MTTALLLQPHHYAPASTPPTFRRSGTQFLPVSGRLTDRLLVTYRAPAARLAPLVPAPLELDTRDGYGFLSVCAVEIADMGVVGTPRFLRWNNREFLYRLQVRLGDRSTFITLRSDVSSWALALLGRHFSHYRPEHGRIELTRNDSRLCFRGTTLRGTGDGLVEADLSAPPDSGSLFETDADAADYLLGMKRSVDVVAGRVRVQEIEHGPWQPRRVTTLAARFAYLDALAQQLGVRFELDNTLAVHDVPQLWKAAQWLK